MEGGAEALIGAGATLGKGPVAQGHDAGYDRLVGGVGVWGLPSCQLRQPLKVSPLLTNLSLIAHVGQFRFVASKERLPVRSIRGPDELNLFVASETVVVGLVEGAIAP